VSVVQDREKERAAVLARGHLPVLDSYRAVAAALVVATHVGFQTGRTAEGLFGAVLSRLDIGVALFFALSGFLLYRPWAVARESSSTGPRVRGYLWRRALRILPAYWVVVVVALAFLPANEGASLATWLANLGLVQIYVPDTLAVGLTQMWSLATEVAFYLLLPALGWLTLRRGRSGRSPLVPALWLAGVLTAVDVAWAGWIHQDGADPGLRGFWLPSFTSWFGLGILLAAAVVHVASGRPAPRALRPVLTLADQPGACWVAALGLFLVAATPLAGPRGFEGMATGTQAVLKNLLYAAVVGLALLPATLGHQGGAFHRVLSLPPLRRLGDISYGIFLWHLVVLFWVFEVTGRPPFSGGFWPVLVETLLGTCAVAAVGWVAMERPLLTLKSRVPV
jgi:peptidoglycan/LPS O-acetylase OafA/YrhL